jgi:hypothetical protein
VKTQNRALEIGFVVKISRMRAKKPGSFEETWFLDI